MNSLSLIHIFSGFAVYNVFFNHFVDVVALFPYLLWALDEAIYENRHGLFAFWVAVKMCIRDRPEHTPAAIAAASARMGWPVNAT